MRYLYRLLAMNESSEKQIKLHRMLSSVLFGIIGSLCSGLLYGLVWLLIAIIYFSTNGYNPKPQLGINIMYVIQVFIPCVLGILIFLVDIFANWKKIREKGILHIFTFEDPFHLRVDILTLFGILCCLILIVIFNVGLLGSAAHVSDILIAILKKFTPIFTYMLGGGFTAVILEWFRRARTRYEKKSEKDSAKATQSSNVESLLEEYLKDETFQELFTQYCTKEFSLENILLYKELQELQKKSQSLSNGEISEEDFHHIHVTYFQNYSKYEVNMPSKVTRELETLWPTMNQKNSNTSNLEMTEKKE